MPHHYGGWLPANRGRGYPLGMHQSGTNLLELIAEDRTAKTGRFVLETAGAAASAAVAIATIAARIGVRVGAAKERLRWFQLSPQLMPIGTVLDDGLADLVAPLEIDRTWRESTASGAASTSPRGTRNDGSSANFKSFPRGRADDHIGSDRGRCLLGLLVGQGLRVSLCLGLSLSLLLLQLDAVDDGSILASDQLVGDELLLEPLLGLCLRLLDYLRSLKRKSGPLLLRLKVGCGHDDLLQLDRFVDAGCDVRLLGLLKDLPRRRHRDGYLIDHLLRSDDVFRLLLLLTPVRFQLNDLVLNLLEQLMLMLLLLLLMMLL